MKRTLLLLLLLLFFKTWAQDQQGNDYFFGENFHFHGFSTDKRMMIRNNVEYVKSAKYIWHVYRSFDNKVKLPGDGLNDIPNSPILLGIKLSPKLKNYFSAPVQNISKVYYSYIVPDSSDAIIVAMGINKDNYKDYVYRVVEHDSIELISWSPIPKLSMEYGAKVPYGAIGTFNYPGKQILVEVRHKKNYGIRDGYIIDWRKNNRPVLKQLIARGSGKYGYFNVLNDSLNKGQVQSYDTHTGVPVGWTFQKDSITEFDLEFDKHETVPYSIHLIKNSNGQVDTLRLEWWTQLDKFTISNQYLNEVGQYDLLVHKTGNLSKYKDSEILRISYRIVPTAIKTTQAVWPIIWPYLLAGSIMVCAGFFMMRSRSRIKMKQVQQQKQAVTLQIKNIQAQLNPHFMFNAINSIQNLIQKNDLIGTNHYLSKFASVTRATLENAEKEMNPLSEELQLLDDYLQMEQLRFGFHYQIENKISVHADLIEIPTMLLQPIVENAVKHGIAILGNTGMISIIIDQLGQTMRIYIEDNGAGFDYTVENNGSGYGLRLSKERLNLLNKLYPENTFHIEIKTTNNKTQVCILISNWISKN